MNTKHIYIPHTHINIYCNVHSANAAYSLYGIKKDSNDNIFSGKCNKKHFINSFFTYGGADTLLKAVRVRPIVYYEGYTYDGDGNDNRRERELAYYYDDGYVNATNADCVEVDYEEPVEEEEEVEDEEEQEEGSGDRRHKRNLGSGSQDQQNDGYSSTLGCDADNKFIVGVFQGNSCDGNYYRTSLDSVSDYNKQHRSIGCQQIWKDDGGEMYVNADYATVYALLKRSWACDPRLYPNECPDPYNEKNRYEYALQTAAHGGNGMRAYKNEEMRKPLRITAWVLFSLTLVLLLLAYFIGNRKRMAKHGASDRNNVVRGAGMVIKEDVSNIGWKASLVVMMGFNSARDRIKEKIDKGDSFLDDCNIVQPAESESDSVRKSKLDKALKDCRRYSGAESFHVVEKVDGVIQSGSSSQPADPLLLANQQISQYEKGRTISKPDPPVENVTTSVQTEDRKQQEGYDDADGVLL